MLARSDKNRDNPYSPLNSCNSSIRTKSLSSSSRALPPGIGDRHPSRPDNGQHHIALAESAVDRVDEVITGLQRVNIDEHVVLPELSFQTVEYPAA